MTDNKSTGTSESLTNRLRDFLETEARSCSMDPGCITPEYVYRMWGGKVSLEAITEGLKTINNNL